MMTLEERYAVMDANTPAIGTIHVSDAYFDWGWKGCGFGQLSFNVDREAQKITCMNECMSREMVRKILIAFANKVADECIMDCDRETTHAAAKTQGE